MKIIYTTSEGTLAFLTPSREWEDRMLEIGKKDVTKGLKFKIVEDSDIPSDRSFRNAWEVDEAELTDGVGEQE